MNLKKKIIISVLIYILTFTIILIPSNKRLVKENNRGVAYMGQFDFIKARNIFDKLVKEYPKNVELKINLAIATLNRQEKGDERIALSILKDVLDIDKNNLYALYCSGLLELYLGNPNKALLFFDRVKKRTPYDPEVLYFIGKTLIQLSRYRESIAYFNQTIKYDQYMSSAYYGLVQAYRQLGDRETAIKKIKDFQKIKNNPRVRSLEFKYTKMGKKGEVIAINHKQIKKIRYNKGPIFKKRKIAFDKTALNRFFTDPKMGLNSSITVCDINGDNTPDIFISNIGGKKNREKNTILFKNSVTGRYSIDSTHPLNGVSNVNAVLWGDLNNDTLTDVYFCRNGKNQLWQQNAKGSWKNISKFSEIENGDYNTVDGLLFDADHDGDLDIFLINENGPNELLNNDRTGKYRPLAKKYGLSGISKNSRSIIVSDLDNDRDVDIIIINKKAPHEVYINDRLWRYHRGIGFEEFINTDIIAVVSGDVDTDGHNEFYTMGADGTIFVWEKNEKFKFAKQIVFKGDNEEHKATIYNYQLALEDVDSDGALDLIFSNHSGLKIISLDDSSKTELWSITNKADWLKSWNLINSKNGPSIIGLNHYNKPILWSSGLTENQYILIDLAGTKKDEMYWRSNASGIGTKLSVRVGSNWTVFDTFKNTSGTGQSYQPIMVGLNGEESIDFVAIDWSDGVFQTELNLQKGKTHKIFEKQRQLSSCPVLFTWNGEKFEFVSDLLGVGGIGYAVAPGEYAPPRPWENFLFPEGVIKPLNNRFIIQLTEPMEESTYLDSVKLITYDLPPGWSMTLDERMGISGPMPSGKPVFYKNILKPIHAFNNRKKIVTDFILKRDLKAAPVGKLDNRFVGMLKEDHILTIEFSDCLDKYIGEAFLVIDGWVEYPYSQTNFAAWQANRVYQAPTIEIEKKDGSWSVLLSQFGYPAGMPRQMSVPLGPNLKGVRRLRISTNQEIYWDRIFIAYSQTKPELIKQELRLKRAELEKIGFPSREDSAQHLPYYNYKKRKPLGDTRFLEGDYTRFGRVDDLLNRKDNAFVIFGAGEGLTIEFLKPEFCLKKGWRRYFVLETHGWCKDMDLYTKDNETLSPIPFIGETDRIAKKLQKKYNNRYLSGRQ